MAQETLDLTGLAYFKSKLASWIPSWFPSQSGQSGKVLTTDGTNLSWTSAGGGSVTDVQVNGTSVVSSGVANVPVMDANTLGVAKVGANLSVTAGVLSADVSTSDLTAFLPLAGGTLVGTAYGVSSDSANSLLTTVGITKRNLGANASYVKFGNGLIIQWGYGTNASATVTVNFAVPFTDQNSYVQFAMARTSDAHYASSTTPRSTTSCSFVFDTAQNFVWIAVGF